MLTIGSLSAVRLYGERFFTADEERDVRQCTQMGRDLNDLSGRVIGCAFTVMYDGIVAGAFTVDLLVELRAVAALNDARRGQCLNYVKATGLRLCLLLNFGNPRLEIKRIAHGM